MCKIIQSEVITNKNGICNYDVHDQAWIGDKYYHDKINKTCAEEHCDKVEKFINDKRKYNMKELKKIHPEIKTFLNPLEIDDRLFSFDKQLNKLLFNKQPPLLLDKSIDKLMNGGLNKTILSILVTSIIFIIIIILVTIIIVVIVKKYNIV